MTEEIRLCIMRRGDEDIPMLEEFYCGDDIAKFISIDRSEYFSYVCESNDVEFFKILYGEDIAGTLHAERSGDDVSLAIVIFRNFRRRGIAEYVLRNFISDLGKRNVRRAVAYIDASNEPSVALFRKCGFECSPAMGDGDVLCFVFYVNV